MARYSAGVSLELDATVAAPTDATVTDDGRAPRPAPAGGLRVGAMLAHFRVDALLGHGGMGEVYRATDLALDRPVALKVLPAAVAQDVGRRERLIREARAQARVAHPNVCHIYYVGQEDGVVFFAMELVDGESLAERIARGPLPAAEAVEIVRQAALGLRAAAAHGFTHRDVKPSNLMVDRAGMVKVVDFGLVAQAGAEEGGVVGTPLYMAPEQAAGEATDARADIYALGATLHHLVAGRPPFEGDTALALATRHRDEARPRLVATGRRGRAMSAVDQVVARMMAKRADERFASYDALVAELERISPARTRPGGLWVRAIAAFIDMMVLVVALAPVHLLLDVWDREVPGELALALAGPLYTAVGLSRWGTTVGRWLLDLEVVTVGTLARPSVARALARHLVEYGPLSAAIVLGIAQRETPGETVDFLAAMLALAGIIWGVGGLARAAIVTPDKRTVWDRVAGTMVRYRTPAA